MYKRQVNAATIMPTEKECRELEQLKERMEIKTEEMEAGFNTLIELQPQDEKRFLEKKKEIIDIAVKAHARLVPAIARCHNPVTANRVTQDTRDPQGKIREGLRPGRLKMDFTPVEFWKWKSQITTFFEASNLQYATQKEQHRYLHMCPNANLTNHLNVNTTAAKPVIVYFEEDDERNCLDIIEEFVKRYPIMARRHDPIQLKQQRGQLLTTFIDNLMSDATRFRSQCLGTPT